MSLDIIRLRLANQRLAGTRFARPAQTVAWMGAMQAQEYADSKWAVSLRTRAASESAIEQALSSGSILRTHVLRPTWHFVAAADIRWMLELTGPRVSARMAPYNRRPELDAGVFRRSRNVITRSLRGGKHLTRQQLKASLQKAGIHTDVQRLAHIVMQAELDAVICSGARRDGQFTYALLHERVAPTPSRSRDDSLAELTRRYFRSHGPAQLADFVWWSGLTTGDARRGLEMVGDAFDSDVIKGKTYWFPRSAAAGSDEPSAHLLGLYDEYLIAYKDRSAASPERGGWTRAIRDPFTAPIIVNGQVVGGWRRFTRKAGMEITLTPLRKLSKADAAAVAAASLRYARFFGVGSA